MGYFSNGRKVKTQQCRIVYENVCRSGVKEKRQSGSPGCYYGTFLLIIRTYPVYAYEKAKLGQKL